MLNETNLYNGISKFDNLVFCELLYGIYKKNREYKAN